MNNKKRIFLIFLCIGLITFSGGCSGFDLFGTGEEEAVPSSSGGGSTPAVQDEQESEPVLEDDPTTKEYDNGIYFDEEEEDAVIETKKADVLDFTGSWEATSGQSAYMYGNVDLKINANGTWTGNISEEPLNGKWKKDGDTLLLSSEIFNCTLQFSKDGNLLMQEVYEDSDEEAVIVVLTKK